MQVTYVPRLSNIKVKGQRTDKTVWGKDAVATRFKEIKDDWVLEYAPITIQMYGDATDDALERVFSSDCLVRALRIFCPSMSGAPVFPDVLSVTRSFPPLVS